LHEIVVRIEGGFLEMVLHWQGGDHNPAAAEDEWGRQASLDGA
jgi:hypothetical protein